MHTATQEMEAAVYAALCPAEKAQALQALAEHLTESNPKRAVTVAQELRQLALVIADQPLYIKSLLNAAWAMHNLADYGASLTQALEALKLAGQHKLSNLAYDALNIIGTNHQVVGNRPDALDAFMQALRLARETNNPLEIATVQNNIGLVYEGLEDYGSSLSYYEQALDAYQQANAHPVLRTIAAANVAESHNHLGQYEQALMIARSAASTAANAGFVMGEGLALMHQGSAYSGLSQYEAAESCFSEAMERLQSTDATYQRATLLHSMATLKLKRGDKAAGIATLQQALAIAQSLEALPALFPLHRALAQAYASVGDYEQAFRHMEQFHEIKERVFNVQADSREKTLQAVYEVDKARLETENQRHRNLALQKVIEQNESMIAELDSYADNVAHDLRNPIALIIGFADLIQTDSENQFSDASQVSLLHLQAAAEKLNEIVNALLSLAKARKQEILPQPVNMSIVLGEALQRLQPVIQRTGATIAAPDDLPPCMGNASWLEEALVNYIGNAIKYGGNPPQVHIDYVIESDGMISYRVADNGRGLTPDEQARLFRKFERLGQQKIEGTGIGLMIVKTVVEKLDGRVSVHSTNIPGEGSIFSMTLPPAE
ncbi:MAG: tetratricopeptide repeat-containing sensor histidine kinase [Chloroflexota bacterium]|nr:tetratricopeptide repeat-containing sensor histidine kinase [Chloroflexota bacterium]